MNSFSIAPDVVRLAWKATYDVKRHIDAGELVELMPRHRAAPMPMTLLYPHRQHLSRRLQVFADWLTDLLKLKLLAAA
ncbi:DNA-binding transcriptional LysR family regulator [Bradyrhizobium elkanii]|nr:DNA-binding transcriptional LysR family regulator [Bradyrhizobium elkanii]MCS3562242.1 DNA-binding transcriptional LysR family regulator [Bradyrhizobium elkanii]MCW2147920.1 DNA-binding transcriptional LysR family regulator [Bradyrhizobium elkanii]MCW2352996.1 DNA-binding transcriptional LysR family regulator [Bradyrhizobium elkanii]MCW2371646.1 DNA-binding transcriptional LysR family regulator [Bradyrhizobium elkanii]